MPALYRWLFAPLLYLLALPFLVLHPKVRHGLRERLGLYSPERLAGLRGLAGPRLWLHGASAGDLLALRPLMVRLRQRLPRASLIVTTITNSGMQMADKQLAGLADVVLWAPWDLAGATRRALRAIRPDVLVLEYTELWPNLMYAAEEGWGEAATAPGQARHRVPLVLHNGRLSQHNLLRYRSLFSLTGNLLRRLSLLLMRDDREAERALLLGAPPERVRVTGNTKFDHLAIAVEEAERERRFGGLFAPRPDAPAAERAPRAGGAAPVGPVWVAGSIHEGEFGLIVEQLARLRQTLPAVRLAVAPRYIEKAAALAALAEGRGFTVARRSLHSPPPLVTEAGGAPIGAASVTAAAPQPAGAPVQGVAEDVFVLDTIGELLALYLAADVVFVGGSFTTRGGQNILEPAACGRPVLFGPHMENFADSVELLQGRGGIQVTSEQHLHDTLRTLLERPDQAKKLGALARQTVGKVSGAADRNAELIARLIARDGAGDDGG